MLEETYQKLISDNNKNFKIILNKSGKLFRIKFDHCGEWDNIGLFIENLTLISKSVLKPF